jgi:hypothetical protein
MTKELLNIPPRKSRTEAERFFQTVRQEWETSEPCRLLRSTLASAKTPLGIKKIIAFACGPFSFELVDAQRSWAVRRVFQHALLLTLRDIFQGKEGNPETITCFAQDPAYTEIDEFVLERHGVITAPDPKGFLEVDSSAVVVSIAANIPVRQIVSDLARPAILVWDRLRYDDSTTPMYVMNRIV